MNLSPPSENRFYSSCETFFTAVNQHAANKGYAVVTKQSKKTKDGELWRVWLHCNKGAKYVLRGYGKRSSSTCLTECSFEIIAKSNSKTSQWSLTVKNPEHNHPPTLADAHSVHRQIAMTKEVQNIIAVQMRINSSAKRIFSAIQLDTDEKNPIFKSRDIYNQCTSQKSN